MIPSAFHSIADREGDGGEDEGGDGEGVGVGAGTDGDGCADVQAIFSRMNDTTRVVMI